MCVAGETAAPVQSARKPARRALAVVGSAFIAIAGIRIVSTYPVFNQTYDEPISVACGMEWLDRGVYEYDQKHPPLGRVAAALPLYLSGSRSSGNSDDRLEGNVILNHHRAYWRNLTLARLGTLPFFLLACCAVWAWSAWAWGAEAGLLAVAFLSTLPPVLGHAGLAMTDVALLATLPAALLSLGLWLERPSLARASLLGACAGLAILCKLTALVLFPACGLPIVASYALRRKSGKAGARRATWVRTAALALAIAGFLIWAGYRFSFGPYDAGGGKPHAALDQVVGQRGLVHDAVYGAMHARIPAPEFVSGIRQLWLHNRESDYNWFLGQRSNAGWPVYYPVILAVKTPAALLALFAIGAAALLAGERRRCWRSWTLLWPVAAILAVGLASHVNIGVRHILPIYAAICSIAAFGALRLFRASRLSRALSLGLLLWLAAESASAHPDYLAYFNEFADGASGKYGVESDLDYGQDLARLGRVSARRGIDSLALAYHGTADPALFGLTRWHALTPGAPETGWIAISMYDLKLGEEKDPGAYSWLERLEPVEVVGKSIRLYWAPPGGSTKIAR